LNAFLKALEYQIHSQVENTWVQAMGLPLFTG